MTALGDSPPSNNVLARIAQKRLARILNARLNEERALARAEAEAKLSVEEKARLEKEAQVRTRAERWREDPALYALDRFGLTLIPEQVEILKYLAFGEKDLVAVKAGQKCTKTNTGAVATYWFAECHGYERVNLLSASGDNLAAVLWAELIKLWTLSRRAAYPVEVECPPVNPTTGFSLAGCRVLGLVAAKVENIGGYSGAKQLFVCDEASSDKFDLLWEGVEGNRTGGGKALLLGNPTRVAGVFFNVWRQPRNHQLWQRYTLDAEKIARYGIPGLADAKTIAKRIEVNGRQHNLVKIRVLGEFPDASANSIVGFDDFEEANERWRRRTPADEARWLRCAPEYGVDVAWEGDDDSVIQPRRDLRSYRKVEHHGQDPVQLAERVLELVDRGLACKPDDPAAVLVDGRPYLVPPCRLDEVARVKVDTIGIGAGTYAYLLKVARQRDSEAAARKDRRLSPAKTRLVVVAVNVAARSDVLPSRNDPGYSNLRSQVAFAVSEHLKEGAVVEPDERLEEELLAATYSYDAQGRRKAESKQDVKERIGRSPDAGDAFALSVYRGRSAVVVDDSRTSGVVPGPVFDDRPLGDPMGGDRPLGP